MSQAAQRTVAELAQGIQARHLRAVARAISLVENRSDGIDELLTTIHPMTGHAQRIGVTGPPGAGKSTLVASMVSAYRQLNKSVGVVAVDPSSPFTGGALLGDRVRMEALTLDPGVFIRSMASRGAAGGLSVSAQEACDVLDAAGFDIVIVETVGVGQSELAIAGSCDTAVLVLVPESGDGVQVLKAGVMEIADIYVINKSDRPDAPLLVTEILETLKLNASHKDRPWAPPVLSTVATEGQGIAELIAALDERNLFLESSGEGQRRRRERLKRHTHDVVDRMVQQQFWNDGIAVQSIDDKLDDVVGGKMSAYELAKTIVEMHSKHK